MGLSGWILTKERITDIENFKDDIMRILERFPCECHAYKENDEYFISIVENNDEYGVSMYAADYDTPEDIPICDGQGYYCAIYIEKLGEDEQLNMLLEFMYYYLKLYPDHVFSIMEESIGFILNQTLILYTKAGIGRTGVLYSLQDRKRISVKCV